MNQLFYGNRKRAGLVSDVAGLEGMVPARGLKPADGQIESGQATVKDTTLVDQTGQGYVVAGDGVGVGHLCFMPELILTENVMDLAFKLFVLLGINRGVG